MVTLTLQNTIGQLTNLESDHVIDQEIYYHTTIVTCSLSQTAGSAGSHVLVG